MTNPLTDTDLDAIRAREQAATPGPWTGAVEPRQAAAECDDVDMDAYVRDSHRGLVALVGEGW